jgi:hypothetical protein
MVTLDIVPLRSKMPHTGRVTLRYQLPTIKIDVPGEFDRDDRAADLPRIATTPQVDQAPEGESVETAAREGGEAR